MSPSATGVHNQAPRRSAYKRVNQKLTWRNKRKIGAPKPRQYQTCIKVNSWGQHWVELPPWLHQALRGSPSNRVWFQSVDGGVLVTKKPTGPRPPSGRSSSRLRQGRTRRSPRRKLIGVNVRGRRA